VGIAGAAWGTVLVGRPDVLSAQADADWARTARRATVALGVREVLQGLLVAWRPGPRLVRAATTVTTLHAASMAALALCVPGLRSTAGRAALVASGQVMLLRATGRRAPAPHTEGDR
jgi:hypothetical protein